MIKEKFDSLIKSNSDLNKLLNEEEIIGFADFSKLTFNDIEFRNYIEQSYIKSFKRIYKKYTIESLNDAKINALLRSIEHLGNNNIIKEIELDLNQTLISRSLQILKKNKNIADINIENIDPKELSQALDITIINILNKVKSSPIIQKTKDEIIAHCLYINHSLKDVNPKHHKALYLADEEIKERLKKIDGYHPSQKSKYIGYSNNNSTQNENQSQNEKPILEVKKEKNYWVYVALGIGALLLKMCSGL